MSDLTFVQYDTSPPVYGTLSNITQIDLQAATQIRFQMRLTSASSWKVDAVAAIDSAPALRVRYSWAANDLSMPGEYIARWEIHFGDGTVQHTEPENTITVDPD